MFLPEDFELPLEKQLKMRIVSQEVEECKSVEVLQINLKQCAESLMRYQHLLSVVLQRQIENDLNSLSDKIEEETTKLINAYTAREKGDV